MSNTVQTDQAGARPGPAGTRSAQGWVLALTSLASFMVILDVLVVATALTAIRRDLGTSLEEVEWTVNAYTLSFAVLLMTATALGNRFGRRRVFAVGLGLFAISSAGCALAPSVGALIAARAVQGAGAAAAIAGYAGRLGQDALRLFGARWPARVGGYVPPSEPSFRRFLHALPDGALARAADSRLARRLAARLPAQAAAGAGVAR